MASASLARPAAGRARVADSVVGVMIFLDGSGVPGELSARSVLELSVCWRDDSRGERFEDEIEVAAVLPKKMRDRGHCVGRKNAC